MMTDRKCEDLSKYMSDEQILQDRITQNYILLVKRKVFKTKSYHSTK